MKRLLCGCAAFVLLTALILPMRAHAGWAEGLFLQEPNSLQGGLLAPGEAVSLPLNVLVDGNPAPLTDRLLEGEKLTLTVEQGSAHLAHARLTQKEGVHTLELKAASVFAAPAAPVSLTLRRMADGQETAACQVSFRVGWPAADDDLLDNLQAGEAIPVDSAAPAFTRAQIQKLMERGGRLVFQGEGWRYEVTPASARDVCLLFSADPIGAVANRLQEEGRELAFFSFPAASSLGKGTLTLEVPSLAGEEALYVYRYAYGRLYRYPAAYDAAAGTVSFTTSVLDRFVVTNLPVQEGLEVGGTAAPTPDHTEKNPDTGDFSRLPSVGAAAVLACAVALLAGKKHEK